LTYSELIQHEPRLTHEKAHFENGILLCSNCSTPDSASMSIAVGWIGCGPCITGEADSFKEEDIVIAELR
jgi:hypothetical protein